MSVSVVLDFPLLIKWCLCFIAWELRFYTAAWSGFCFMIFYFCILNVVMFCSVMSQKQLGEPANDALGALSLKINQLKKQIQAERIVYIKVRLILRLCCLSLILLGMGPDFYSLFAEEITFCFYSFRKMTLASFS